MGEHWTDPGDLAWCIEDGCPSGICNGPHVAHTCPESNGDTIVVRFDNAEPCLWCGRPGPAASRPTGEEGG